MRGGIQGVDDGGQGVEQGGQRLVTEWAEGGGDELLDLREKPVEQILSGGRDVDQDPAPVGRVRLPPDMALALEGVQDGGHRRGGDVHPGADLARGKRAARAFHYRQCVERGMRQPMAAGNAGDQGVGLGADLVELLHHPCVEPSRAGVLALERLGFGQERRGGSQAPGVA